MKEQLNSEQWAMWEPILNTRAFDELSETERIEALHVFGSEEEYTLQRESLLEAYMLAKAPIPRLRSAVKRGLDTAWAEQTQAARPGWWLRPTLPSYQWAVACLLFMALGWLLSTRGEPEVQPPEVVYQTRVDTVFQALPPDTIRIVQVQRVEVPVQVVQYVHLLDTATLPGNKPGIRVADDDDLWQWMISETE